MKRKALGLAVVLAALAVLINVFALKSATINNDITVTITDTTSALIAVSGGSDPDVDFSFATGKAQITLPKTAGLQPGSIYTFYPAFVVTNNSAAAKTIDLVGSDDSGVAIKFVNAAGTEITTLGSVDVGPGNAKPVGIKLDLMNLASAAVTPSGLTITLDVH